MQSVVPERESGWPWMIANSIHVWSSSPRTNVLGHSQSSLRDLSRWITLPRTASWAILSRPYGTDRYKLRELICFQRVRYNSGASKKLIWTGLAESSPGHGPRLLLARAVQIS